MLDECRGEKFEEVIAAFSTVVLHKVISEEQKVKQNITGRLVLAHKLPLEEQRSLIPLAIAHRFALTGVLQKKARLRARYLDFQRRLNTKEQELRMRTEALEAASDARENAFIHDAKITELRKHFDTHWQGDSRWIDTIFDGGDQINDSLLDTPFPTLWQSVRFARAQTDVVRQEGLIQQLEKKVATQEARLQKWKRLRKDYATFEKFTTKQESLDGLIQPTNGLDLNFSRHMRLALDPPGTEIETADLTPAESSSVANEEYAKLMESMRRELAQVDNVNERNGDEVSIGLKAPETVTRMEIFKKPIGAVSKMRQPKVLSKSARLPTQANGAEKLRSAYIDISSTLPNEPKPDMNRETHPPTPNQSYPSRRHSLEVNQPSTDLEAEMDQEEILAQEIVLSTMNAPSPIKPKLSLSERTRKSMALASPKDLDQTAEPSPISSSSAVNGANVFALSLSSLNPTPRETLFERTRQSMSLVTPKPRKSITDRQRASKNFPINQFSSPEKSSLTPPEALFGQDVNYASVFKSRPKIALSPTLSPIDARSHAQDNILNVQHGEDWGYQSGGSPSATIG